MIKRIVSFIPFILIINFTGILVYYITHSFNRTALEAGIRTIEPLFLWVNFLLIIIFLAINFETIRNRLSKINRYVWILLLLIFILGLSLRMFATPHTHRLYFDEDIYLDMGKEILLHGQGSLCNYGNDNICNEYSFMKWPNSYPFLLALSYLFFGISENVAFALVTLLASLSVVLIFLIAYLFSGKEKVALFSALLFSLIPIHIIWSGSVATEPVYIFFTLAAIFCFSLTFKSDNWKLWALAIFVLAYAVQIRTEGLILLPIISILILLFDKNRWKRFINYKFLVMWLIFFVLITPYLVHVYYSSLHETWGSKSDEVLGLSYMARNIPDNLMFWVAGYPTIEHPILFTIFMLIGLVYLLKSNRKLALFLLIWFMLLFLLYASFYAGGVRYGVDVRYSLNLYAPFVILGGFGLYKLTGLRAGKEMIISLSLVVIILSSFIFYLPSISTPIEEIAEAKQARYYHDFALNAIQDLDDSCYILSHVPSMYLVAGKGSLQTWYGQNSEIMDDLFEETDCIIFDDGFWCWVEPYKSSVCKNMFDGYILENITSLQVDNKNYGLYYVRKK